MRTVTTTTTGLLHNMSAPPKTTISWRGLGAIGDTAGTSPVASSHTAGMFGIAVRFSLELAIARKPPAAMLRHLGHRPGPDPAAELRALIDAHAASLPLPDGCAVIRSQPHHAGPWTDTLSALAVLTKRSRSVWLRAKTPSLSALPVPWTLSLLVPPSFAALIPGLLP